MSDPMAATQPKRGSTNVTALVQPPRPQLQQAYVECHSESHQWRPNGRVDPVEAEPGMRAPWNAQTAVGRRSQCVNCGAERIRWYTRSGEVVNRYRYQDGYLHQRGPDEDPAPSRLDWRKRLIVSLFDDLGTPATQEQTPKRARRQG